MSMDAPVPGFHAAPTRARDTALSRGERVARDGAFTSRRGSGEGSPTESAALSRGERVAHDGAFTSRRGSGEGSRHCCTPPAQNTTNSRNELQDLLQRKGLTNNYPSKRTASEAQNEVVGGVNEWAGLSRPIHEPTPHPSCSGWRKRRSPTPSPQGRGLLRRAGGRVARDSAITNRRGSGEGSPTESAALSRGERVARDGAFTSRRGSGEGSLHCCPHPSQNTENSRNELHDLLQSKALTTNDPSKRTGNNYVKDGYTRGWRANRGVPACAPGKEKIAV